MLNAMRGTSILLLFAVCMISYSTQNGALTWREKRLIQREKNFANRYRLTVSTWSKGVCKRPETGACAEAGTCCGEKKGQQQWLRKCKDAYPRCGYKLIKYRFPCEITCEADPCDPNPCLHNKECSNSQWGYACSCPSGFYETARGGCEAECTINDPCECQWNPCEDHATCVDETDETGDAWRCICPDGYKGATCSEQDAPSCPMSSITPGQTGVGKIECDSTPGNAENSKCKFTCASGYELQSTRIHTISCSGGKWMDEIGLDYELVWDGKLCKKKY